MAQGNQEVVTLFSANTLPICQQYDFSDRAVKQKVLRLLYALRLLKRINPRMDTRELFAMLLLLSQAFCKNSMAVHKLQAYPVESYFREINKKIYAVINHLQSDNSSSQIHIVFSDIDNTLIHKSDAKRFLPLLGEERIISKRTISLLAQIGQRGIPIVLISGRRISSFKRIMRFIPHSFAILEHGCVILQQDGIDMSYASQFFEYIGDPNMPHKYGFLWEYERQMQEHGYDTDSKGRLASFRIDPSKNRFGDAMTKQILTMKHPNSIKTVQNLQFIDFIPPMGGKDNAITYILQKFGIKWDKVACIGDDYNDITMLSKAKYVFTHSGAIPQVQQLVQFRNGYVSPYSGHAGTADILGRLMHLIDG